MSRALPLSLAAGLSLLLATGGPAAPGADRPGAASNWQAVLAQRLPTYGHRNWIAGVDSAYPAQTSAGIETVVSHAGQLDVLRQVLDALGRTKHVRPVVCLDAGLPEAEVAALCRVAAEVDRGLFEAAGFRFQADTYRPGSEGCCFLHVRPGAS
jgi:hypothetical protein